MDNSQVLNLSASKVEIDAPESPGSSVSFTITHEVVGADITRLTVRLSPSVARLLAKKLVAQDPMQNKPSVLSGITVRCYVENGVCCIQENDEGPGGSGVRKYARRPDGWRRYGAGSMTPARTANLDAIWALCRTWGDVEK